MINGIRRLVAEDLDALPRERRSRVKPGMTAEESAGPASSFAGPASSSAGMTGESPLMRSKYCVRYELGLCPKYQGAKPPQELFLLNNGRRLALRFDCAACEMTVTPA